MRYYDTGATRDSADDKLDYDGFFSPLSLDALAQYMHTHRVQADGELRASDNWMAGIPQEDYRKSSWRHFFDCWAIARGYERTDKKDGHIITLEEALCALAFNVLGWLHEVKKEQSSRDNLDWYRRILEQATGVPEKMKGIRVMNDNAARGDCLICFYRDGVEPMRCARCLRTPEREEWVRR